MRLVIPAAVSVLAVGAMAIAVFYQPAHALTPAEKAKQRYDFLVQNGASEGEQCRAAKALEDAYADAQDAYNYKLAKITADAICLDAEMPQRLNSV